MKHLIYVPLERLDDRYTAHLDRDILAYLRKNRIDYDRIDAPYTDPPPSGQFLNAGATIMNKMHQLHLIAHMYAQGRVTDDTVFFFSDLFFPGIESLKYLNHFYKVNPRITGIVHAGSFTYGDEVSLMTRWAAPFENILFDICDRIYVGSEHIKFDMFMKRTVQYDKVIVTGLPLDNEIWENKEPCWPKRNLVVFTGRDHFDKQPHLWYELKRRFAHTDIEFVWTQESHLSKPAYYSLLRDAKLVVSFALQENFGYGVAEAVSFGARPILPNRLCYPEMYKDIYLYEDFEQCVEMVDTFIRWTHPPETPPFVNLKTNTSIFNTWFNENTDSRQ